MFFNPTPASRQFIVIAISLLLSQSLKSEELAFDLDSLLNADVQVTSAMKRSQSLNETASSIYVLSGDQIIKSGVTKVPEMLRLVPGVQVRQVDKNQYAIGIRFAGSAFASKLLIMIDGHAVYHPAVSSTYWEMIDIAPEDIDRIEVIRGQTGNLWGFNALNGVINIITKQNIDHLTPTLSVNLETDASIDINASKGGRLSDSLSYRIYGSKRASSDSVQSLEPTNANDNANITKLGAKFDLNPNDQLFLSSTLDYTKGSFGRLSDVVDLTTGRNNATTEAVDRESWRWSARINHRLNDRSEQSLQINAEDFRGSQLFTDEKHSLIDADYQLHTQLGHHQLDVGINYRNNDIQVANGIHTFDLGSDNRFESLGGFVQFQLNIVPDKVSLILGNLSTHDSYIGEQHQPSARTIFNISEEHSLWLSLSRAARSPSYFEFDLRSRIGGTSLNDFGDVTQSFLDGYAIPAFLEGSDQAQAEIAFSREMGYRYNGSKFSVDAALFSVKTDNVLNYQFEDLGITPAEISQLISDLNIAALQQLLATTEINAVLSPGAELDTKGGEISISWRPSPMFEAELSYSIFDIEYDAQTSQNIAKISQNSQLEQLMFKGQYQINEKQHLYLMLRTESGASYNTGRITNSVISWTHQLSPQQSFSVNIRNGFNNKKLEFLNTNETQTIPSYSGLSVGLNWLTRF